MRVHHQLLICTQVKESASGIVRPSGKCMSIGKKLEVLIERWEFDIRKTLLRRYFRSITILFCQGDLTEAE